MVTASFLLVAATVFSVSAISKQEICDDDGNVLSSVWRDVSAKDIDTGDKLLRVRSNKMNEDLTFYITLCSDIGTVKNETGLVLPEGCDDGKASVCVVREDGSAHISNAGTVVSPPVMHSSTHISMTMKDGQSCVHKGVEVGFSSRFDFFCDEDRASNNFVAYQGMLGNCTLQFFVLTPRVCKGENDGDTGNLDDADIADSCLVSMGENRFLDLADLAADDSHFNATDGKRHFQLNLCALVGDGACPPGSYACEVSADGTSSLGDLAPQLVTFSTSFDASTRYAFLHYDSFANERVVIEVRCDANATSGAAPRIVFGEWTKGVPNEVRFVAWTRALCDRPMSDCRVQGKKGQNYDLTGLMKQRLWTASNGDAQTIDLSVCQPLPATSENKCPGENVAACYVKGDVAFSLGSFELNGPTLRPDGQLVIEYNNGSNSCPDNPDLASSTEIRFLCGRTEEGPRVVKDALSQARCRYLIEWNTPYACEITSSVVVGSKLCAVREAAFGTQIDFSGLFNGEKDYEVADDDHLRMADDDHFRINICGGGLKMDCAGVTGASVCRVKNGAETAIGLNSAGAVFPSGDNRMTSLEYNSSAGVTCDEVSTRQVETKFVLMCDPTDTEGRPEFVNYGACTFLFVWRTALVCPVYKEVDCAVEHEGDLYDLSELTNPAENYVVPALLNGRDFRFELNVCRSLVVTGSAAGDGDCPARTSVCLKEDQSDSDDGRNLGEVAEGPKMVDGKLVLEYRMGEICTDPGAKELHVSTAIYFKCDRRQHNTSPRLVKSSLCHNEFLWETSAACKIKTAEKKGGGCNIRSTDTDQLYRFGPLFRDEGAGGAYEIKAPGGIKFLLNICGELRGDVATAKKCGEESGSCLVQSSGGNETFQSLGKGGQRILLDNEDSFSLVYSNGAACEVDQRFKYKTVVRFRCLRLAGTADELVFIEKNGCTYLFDFHTTLACKNTIPCFFSAPNGSFYDLSPLMDYEKDYAISTVDLNLAKVDYRINVCKPLTGYFCGHNSSSACMVNEVKNSLRIKSFSNYLGLADASQPLRFDDANNQIVLDYGNGSVCDSTSHYSSEIRFICDKEVAKGKPVPAYAAGARFFYGDNCRKEFEWRTIHACPQISRHDAVAANDKKKCMAYHSFLKGFVNLTTLRSENASHKVEVGFDDVVSETYSLQPCGKTSECDGSICAGTTSLGYVSYSYYDVDRDVFHVRYDGAVHCNGGANYSAEIRFKCDAEVKGKGAPTLFYDLPCHTIFEWRTHSVCDIVNSKHAEWNESTGSKAVIPTIFFLVIIIIAISVFVTVRVKKTQWGSQRLGSVRHFFTCYWRPGSAPLVNEDIQIPAFGELLHDNDEALAAAAAIDRAATAAASWANGEGDVAMIEA